MRRKRIWGCRHLDLRDWLQGPREGQGRRRVTIHINATRRTDRNQRMQTLKCEEEGSGERQGERVWKPWMVEKWFGGREGGRIERAIGGMGTMTRGRGLERKDLRARAAREESWTEWEKRARERIGRRCVKRERGGKKRTIGGMGCPGLQVNTIRFVWVFSGSGMVYFGFIHPGFSPRDGCY